MSPTGARRLRADDYEPAPRPRRELSLVGADHPPRYAENGRRTVTITGRPVPERRRPPRAQARLEARPDRIALWAFLLGLFLILVAAATAGANPL